MRKIRFIMLCCLLTITVGVLVACDVTKAGGIGSNPSIPEFAKNIPASVEEFVDEFEKNTQFSEVEHDTNDGIDYITAKRTVNGKEYEVSAINYGSAAAMQYFVTIKSAYDAVVTIGGEVALKNALAEEGITNFNWDDTGISYTQNGYDSFWKVSGNWWIIQIPYDNNSQNGGNNSGVNLPENIKIVIDDIVTDVEFVKVGDDYYIKETSWTEITEKFFEKNMGTNTWTYYTKTADGIWTSQGNKSESEKNTLVNAAISPVLEDDPVGTETNDTFLGRPCSKYTYTNTEWGLNTVYCIDKETNLCLYINLNGMITEVTEFNTNITSFDGITLPK